VEQQPVQQRLDKLVISRRRPTERRYLWQAMVGGIAKRLLRPTLKRMGYQIVRHPNGDQRKPPWDAEPAARHLFEQVRDYTMTSPERVIALHAAVRYVATQKVPGAMVECGVWRGGSMMAVARTLHDLGETDRELFLYDTFEGPPTPTETDVEKDPAHFARPRRKKAIAEIPVVLQLLPLDEIKKLLYDTGYPAERMHFVVGNVMETIPARAPEQIAILRLDTDSYTSTRHELEHLFPRVSDGGVVIIDDYASFAGAREATDKYLASQGINPLLHRIDAASRMIVVRR
jgi:O-methyltransferase